jgi:hypothetical protein
MEILMVQKNKVLLVALLILIPSTVGAVDKYQPASDAAGKWSYTYDNDSKGSHSGDANYALSPAEMAAFKGKINEVVEALHQNPVTLHPIGFEATVRAGISVGAHLFNHDPALMAANIPAAGITIQFCPLYAEVATGNVHKGCIEVAHCDVGLNTPYYTTSVKSYLNASGDGYDKAIDDASKRVNEVFQARKALKALAPGVTLYSDGVIVAAGTERPYWIPVTAGELFDLQINYWTLRSKKDGNTVVLDMIKKEREKFTAQDLKSPAYHGENPISLISAKPNDKPYMRFNADYFDRKIPRTALQLITIRVNPDICDPGFDEKNYKGENAMDILRYFQFSKAIDGQKIRALLDVK